MAGQILELGPNLAHNAVLERDPRMAGFSKKIRKTGRQAGFGGGNRLI
jgi:hypothetical protein